MLTNNLKVPPVKVNDELRIVITGKSRDYFVKYKGYMIFISGVPEDVDIREEIIIKIINVKHNCAFSEFIEQEE